MHDPVMLEADGRNYEKSAIVAWLKEHDTSPATGVPLHQQKRFVPNHLLRNIIQASTQRVGELKNCGKHC